MLGPLTETFVVSLLSAELASSRPHLRLHHLRVDGGRHEVDAVIELENADLVAFEIKSASAVSLNDARHLVWMRDQLGQRLRAGVVLHAGPRSYELDSRIAAIPIAALWA